MITLVLNNLSRIDVVFEYLICHEVQWMYSWIVSLLCQSFYQLLLVELGVLALKVCNAL